MIAITNDSGLLRKPISESASLNEYLLIIPPDNRTSVDVFMMKTSFKQSYGCSHAAGLKPHITLVNFILDERNERRIIGYFDRFSKSVDSFEVTLDGFGKFLQHTIYVNVQTKAPAVKIVKDLRSRFSNLLRTEEHRPHFITTPHLTVARGMNEDQHIKAWTDWKDKKYNSQFRADKMELLKRKFSGGKYESIAEFSFTGNCCSNVQLMLAL